MSDERLYLAYLVRLWAISHDNGNVVWRVSAEDAHTGERRVFADLGSLCSFLKEVTEQLAAREQSAASKAGPKSS